MSQLGQEIYLGKQRGKILSKRKEKTQKNPFPIYTACQHEQNLQPAKALLSLGPGCRPAGLAPCCFFFGVRPLWWEQGGEKQADPEGRLSPSNSAGVQGRGKSQSKDGDVKGKRMDRCHQVTTEEDLIQGEKTVLSSGMHVAAGQE